MLKSEIDSIEGLPADVAKEYKKDETSGKYLLDYDGRDSLENMRRARDNEKTQHAATKQQLNDLRTNLTEKESEIETLRENASTPEEKRELARKEREFKKEKDSLEKKLGGLTSSLQSHLIDGQARSLSTELTGNADLLLPHIRSRLALSIGDDGKAMVDILDKDGKASSLTMDELKSEFSADTRFASVIQGSRASGGGARTPTRTNTDKTAYDPKASAAEKVARLKASGKIRAE